MAKNTKASAQQNVSPSNYRYDQSGYIVLNQPIRREAASGRFVTTNSDPQASKKK